MYRHSANKKRGRLGWHEVWRERDRDGQSMVEKKERRKDKWGRGRSGVRLAVPKKNKKDMRLSPSGKKKEPDEEPGAQKRGKRAGSTGGGDCTSSSWKDQGKKTS